MNNLLSIIIPTFNASATISKCLESILKQTYNNIEVVVVDGCSTDGTIEKIAAFAEKHKNVHWKSEKDKGIYDAMNKGVRIAKGKWIYFLGSDDILFNNDILKEVFENPNINNYNVLYGNVEIVGSNSWAKDGDIYDGEFDTPKILNKNICHQCIFYKHEFVKLIGDYNPNYKTCADWDYNLRCWSKTKFFYLPKVIASFNAGGFSTTNSIDQVFFDDYVKNVIEYFSISLFNPLINNPYFSFYNSVLYHQKNENYLKYYVYRGKNKIKQKIGLFKRLIMNLQKL